MNAPHEHENAGTPTPTTLRRHCWRQLILDSGTLMVAILAATFVIYRASKMPLVFFLRFPGGMVPCAVLSVLFRGPSLPCIAVVSYLFVVLVSLGGGFLCRLGWKPWIVAVILLGTVGNAAWACYVAKSAL